MAAYFLKRIQEQKPFSKKRMNKKIWEFWDHNPKKNPRIKDKIDVLRKIFAVRRTP
jgi:hypothetical protein